MKKNLGGDGSGVFGYDRYLESRCCFSEPLQCLKMPFPTHVIVTLEEGSFSAPPKEFREKMMAALIDYFRKQLDEEPWSDVEATLWYVVQRIPLF